MKDAAVPILLKDLHFDLKNPRYGRRAAEIKGQPEALNMIAKEFLVDDLLSSISANGFFEGEPLIVQPDDDGGYTVLEGNRRLTALLILADDPRASSQQKRGNYFREKLAENRREAPTEVPVIIVDNAADELQALAYLGTKHIVGARQWDSYAKARWIAMMLEKQPDLPMTQIKEMLGDTRNLVDRMLEGFYFVEQLRDTGRFDGKQSYIKGRGSNPEFPFSWVYTALSNGGIRKFVHLENQTEAKANPIPPDKLQDAADLLEMMFGNRQRQKEPVIEESRDIADLAKALLEPLQSARLREGTELKTVEDESKPLSEQLSQLVFEANERLAKANGIVSLEAIDPKTAKELDDPTLRSAKSAQRLRKSIWTILNPAPEEEIQ